MSRRVLAVFFAAASSLALGAAGTDAATVIRNVTVIDPASASEDAHWSVLLSKGVITALGVIAEPEGVAVVEGQGKFLIPGLWDMHVHLWNEKNQPELYLQFGVTGVRDMGSDFTRTAALRRDIEEHGLPGPHIVTSGAGIDGRRSDDPRLPVIVASTPDEARQAADQMADSGADFIKIFSRLALEPYLALMERARQVRRVVTGHLPDAVRLEDAIELKQASIEHFFGMERMRESRLRAAFQAGARQGTRFTPTLTMHRRTLLQIEKDPRWEQLVDAGVRSSWTDPEEDWRKASADFHEKAPRTWRHYQEMARWLKESGAVVLAGSDTGDPFTIPGATLHDELNELVVAGLSRLEVLRGATSEAARMAGLEGRCGRLERGSWADLVLLEANPLDDIGNTRRIAAVWWRGRLVAR